MRGNMRLAAGDVEKALYDFMRTAEFFWDEKDIQAEANYRAGECLAKMGSPLAAEFYARVVNDFPDSAFAAKARQKQQ